MLAEQVQFADSKVLHRGSSNRRNECAFSHPQDTASPSSTNPGERETNIVSFINL